MNRTKGRIARRPLDDSNNFSLSRVDLPQCPFWASVHCRTLEVPMTRSTTNLKIHSGDWVVVCDGAKALILENAGDAISPNLKTKEVHEQADPKTSEQGTDAPGRSINSNASRRSTMKQTDWHDTAEHQFLI